MFVCDVCGAGFENSHILNDHQVKKHKMGVPLHTFAKKGVESAGKKKEDLVSRFKGEPRGEKVHDTITYEKLALALDKEVGVRYEPRTLKNLVSAGKLEMDVAGIIRFAIGCKR